MAADRYSVARALLILLAGATCTAAGATAVETTPVPTAADRLQPFTVQDLVRLDRVSEIAASPDGKRAVYTLRSTEMEENRARTGIWLVDTGTRGAVPLRLTDIAANSSSAEWSGDGRFIYFLSNRSGTTQVWRVAAGGKVVGLACPA